MRDDARSTPRARKPIAAPAGATRGRTNVLWLATLALGLGGAGVVGLVLASHDSPAAEPGLDGLARAAGRHRAIKPRLSGAFRHAECARDDSTRLVAGLICRALPRSPPRLAEFAARFNATAVDSGDAAHVHGVFGLFWPEQEGSVEQAIADLRTAADASPERADVQSDLAAAFLVQAEAAEDPASLVDAYLAADSALALDSVLPQARFNLALVLEWLYLRHDAEEAWRAYLAIDSRSAWAREARAHLDRLTIPPPDPDELLSRLREAVIRGDSALVDDVVDRVPWIARRAVVEDALPVWARARRDGRIVPADSALRFARAVAAALERFTGNTLPVEAVAVIDSAVVTGDTMRLAWLVEGQVALAEGTRQLALGPSSRVAAAEHFETAGSVLARAQSPLTSWATYRRAEVWYHGLSAETDDRALQMAESIVDDAPPGHLVVRARAAQMAGIIHNFRADYPAGVAAYDAAVEAAERAGEVEQAARVRGWRSQILVALRGRTAAWRDLYYALASTPRLFDEPRSRGSVFRDVVREISTAAPKLALRFQEEVVRAARMDTPAATVTALAHEGALLTAARNFPRARRDIEEADRLARRLGEVRLLSVVDLARGQLGAAVDPQAGITVLRRTLATQRVTGEFLARASANLYLADAFLSLGHVDSAEAALRTAASEMERRRSLVSGHQERVQFLDQARPVLDRILAFLVNERDPEVAFDFFERTRARVLLERIADRTGNGNSIPSGHAIRPALPRTTALISYAVLDSELLTWVVRTDGIRLVRSPVTSSKLRTLAGDLERAILARPVERVALASSAALFDILVRPILHMLRPDDRLIMLPDKWLHFVPFASLRDTARGEYLVERHEITLAPSALVFTAPVSPARQSSHPSRMLAVGNPAFDRRLFALPALPGAETEVERIATLYPGTRVLVGSSATTDSFRTHIRSADIVHFAGHAVVRPGAPLLSHLVLAPGTRDVGALYARDVFDLDLPPGGLVILSGCHTSRGDLSNTEGVSSLARAFLAAGVRLVVASLWAVEDQQTGEFFTGFHRRVARGQDPAAALRATQLEWLGRNGHADVRTWAAFQAYSGPAGRYGLDPKAGAAENPNRVRLRDRA